MEESQNNQSPEHREHNPLISIMVLVLMLGLVYAVYMMSHAESAVENTDTNNSATASMSVFVENTIAVDGVLTAPKGFPQEIPFESNKIVESAVTHHPYEKVRQFSLDYEADKSVTQKYNEYLNYMKQSGYNLEEENMGADQATLHGTKGNASLYVTVKKLAQGVLVKISYLIPEISG